MSDRMTDEIFAAYETDDAAGMLLMESELEKDNTIVELWAWMQAEREIVEGRDTRLAELKALINTLECYGIWCGKSHIGKDTGLCGACELQAALEQGDGG